MSAFPAVNNPVRYIDLFCGMGGFRIAAEQVFSERGLSSRCVFSSDIDPAVRQTYAANFAASPEGDITRIAAHDIPDHDMLFAGFPCQPFSICGDMNGFEDTRGTLFFDIARILAVKQPGCFVLENVKQLKGHHNGKTLKRILETLRGIGYRVEYNVLNALDFGVPQKRERIFIVGFLEPVRFEWPEAKIPMTPLEVILEKNVPAFYYASESIRDKRMATRAGKIPLQQPTIWHENKSGAISAYPYSCALRAGASYNYLLVNGERRLTEREMLRLQGFPEHYHIVCGYQATRKQAGNSVAVPCVAAVLRALLDGLIPSRIPSLQPSPFETHRDRIRLGGRE